MKNKNSKQNIVLICALCLVIACILCILLFSCSKEKTNTPVTNNPTSETIVKESDIEVADYKEYDYDSSKQDKTRKMLFHSIVNAVTNVQKDDNNTNKDDIQDNTIISLCQVNVGNFLFSLQLLSFAQNRHIYGNLLLSPLGCPLATRTDSVKGMPRCGVKHP